MNQQEPNKFYDEAVQLWMHKQVLGIEEDPPNREDYLDKDASNKFFTREAIEAIKAGNRFKEFSDEFEAKFKPRNPITFYEVVVNFEDLAIKKYELDIARRLINLRDVYLLADRLFFGMNGSNNSYYGNPYKVAVEIESYATRNNLISLKDFRVVECDWIESILQLFMRSPAAGAMHKVAEYSKEQCGHEWTFDELLARVAIGEHQESQRMSKVAQDALTGQTGIPPSIGVLTLAAG